MRLEFYDTTLRDGAQAAGIAFSVADKRQIFSLLENIGMDYIEGGDPASNPKDAEFFAELSAPRLVAFGATRRKDSAPENDAGLAALIASGAERVCIFGKASRSQAEEVLGVTPEQNLTMISESVSYLRARGKKVIFDAEHFYDGFREDRKYALAALMAAYMSGADTLVLCDTNGGSSPEDAYEFTRVAADTFGGATVGVHFHNDTGVAVANSLAAVKAGATHVQGTFLGFGERCGNANLSTVIADLVLKEGAECGIILPELTRTAHALAEICNIPLDPAMPYVGSAAFAHKAGMHADAVIKNAHTFEHMERILLSEMAGRSAVAKKLENFFPSLDKHSPKIKEILDMVKLLEMKGYQFENADGSFVLLAERVLGAHSSAAETGNGPVNALDKALRTALTRRFPELREVVLTDYKVRVVESSGATDAMVRVLITSSDKKESWTTVGVSTDIVEASWQALADSFEYKLTGQCRVV